MSNFMRVTQADVARRAGVSQAAVSLVLSGARRVSEPTRERVLEAIRETGYVRNLVAQRLAGGRTALIGVYTYETTFPSQVENFYYPFLAGIEAEAQSAGVDLVLFTSLPKARNSQLGSNLASLQVADGCVLLGRHSHAEDLAALAAMNYPFAFVGRRAVPGVSVPFVGADYARATGELVAHLHELGHRRLLLLTDETPAEAAEDRKRGYQDACIMFGIPAETMSAHAVRSSPALALRHLRKAGTTGVLVSPDLAGVLLDVAWADGVRVPDDLSIARLGDPERSSALTASWTGFTVPRSKMGARAFQLVLQQIDQADGETAGVDDVFERNVEVPCDVVFGSTTGPSASD